MEHATLGNQEWLADATRDAYGVRHPDGRGRRRARRTIENRKARLGARVPQTNNLRPLLPVEEKGEWLYRQAAFLELEGIVAKRKGIIYRAGRTGDWLKLKTAYGRVV